jgi:hypothetical protein
MVDVAASLVPGYVTVVDFWSESCDACTIVGGLLAAQVARDPEIVVRKVDVGDGLGAVARTYDATVLPHFDIYDKRRRLRYVLIGDDCRRAPDLAHGLVAE